MSAASPGLRRDPAVDAAKTVAIFGTLLIHVSAAGGFNWPVGSAAWLTNLFWNVLVRCAVPVFFLCSGALLLPPQKSVSISAVWKKYIPRILVALLFWAAAYALWPVAQIYARTGIWDLVTIRTAVRNVVLFNHKYHLYYLHIILLVYALLPVTRLFAAKADRQLLRYALGIWFVLGSVYPLLRNFPPFSALTGIPVQYAINLSWGAVGFGLLGHVLTEEAKRHPPKVFALVYLAGFAVTFFGTWALSARSGTLVLHFLQGTAPGVCLQAAGIYGFCVSAFSRRERLPVAETVSKASFCIYLVHVFFLDELIARGITPGVYAPVWAVPAIVLGLFVLSCGVWLVLRRIPLVNRYLV